MDVCGQGGLGGWWVVDTNYLYPARWGWIKYAMCFYMFFKGVFGIEGEGYIQYKLGSIDNLVFSSDFLFWMFLKFLWIFLPDNVINI